MLKSANLLHKWGLGDSQSNSTVTKLKEIVTAEITDIQLKSKVCQYFKMSSEDLTHKAFE